MLGEQRADGMLHLLAHFLHALLHLGIYRGILEMGTDVMGDVAQGKRQPERDAPAPIDDEGRVGSPDGEHERGQKRAHEQACCRGGGHHRAVEPAMIVRRVLRDEGGSASVLACRRERLHHAQQQKQQRRAHADNGIAGQASDQERSAAHEENRYRQGPLATLLVAHVAPENRADGAHEEREREHAERAHHCHRVVFRGEEHHGDNRGQIRITCVVEPFDEVTEEGRPRHLAQDGMFLCFGRLSVRRCRPYRFLSARCHGNHPTPSAPL